MKHLVIDKSNFTKNKLLSKLESYLSNIKNVDTIIFDIHNTIEYNDKEIDTTIFKFIKENYKKINIVLLSYDGNDERIEHNNNLLDNYSDIFKDIPKIFIKKRKKHYIIGYIAKLLKNKYNSYKNIMFVDDNYMNITDAKKLITRIERFKIVHYTAHTKRKSPEGIDDIQNILKNFSI